jgi:hypothetical protein
VTGTVLPSCPGIGAESRVVFPAVSQRFSCGLHPQYYDILARHEDWVHKLLLPDNPTLARQILQNNLTALFVCMSYPWQDTGRVLDVCDLTDWLFFLDTHVTNLRTEPGQSDRTRLAAVDNYLSALGRMLDGEGAPDAPWAMDSVNDLLVRFSTKATSTRLQRLVEAFNHYCTVTIGSEASSLLDHKITDLAGYMEMRAAGGGSAAIFYHVATEYVLGVDLDPKVLEHELVADYWRHIMDYWYLPNDLLSFRVECSRGDHNNAICLLRRVEELSLQQAVDKVAGLIDECQDEAVRRYAEICASPLAAVPGLLPLLETFQAIGAANHRWSFMAPRYHGPGFVWNGVLTGELRLTPDHTFFPDVPVVDPTPETVNLR